MTPWNGMTLYRSVRHRIARRPLVGLPAPLRMAQAFFTSPCPPEWSLGMTPEDTSTVFVIDDDAAVRTSIQGLLNQ